ncbi:MAG TPA: alpha/beta fold hydrolase [Lacipirellulaceae bacterium]|mgnify:CR=1 FL=1|nr:alpha/beta fold hydrolase [Lacipirellulaceae bacterium]HMP05970.1 alpha/beta fold hydrolase [Lacipirellulaceae bacterium]
MDASLAAPVAASAPRTAADAWRALYPFTSRWLRVSDARMHYVDEGQSGRPILLFVHGNPTWSFHWRRLIVALREQYRCIAPDHLGCGLSELQPRPLRLADHIDRLAELIARLDLQNVTLIAQDWGGAIGLGAALGQRDRFRRIVLFNTGAFRPWFIPWRIRACRIPGLGKLAVQGGNLFSRAALTMTLARRRRLDAAVADGYLAPYNSWSRRAAVHQFVRDIPASPRHPTWATLEQIERRLPELASLPVLLSWGMRDWCFTPECLDRFAEVWPRAEIHRLEDAGHWVVEDAPDDVADRLAAFLEATETDLPQP